MAKEPWEMTRDEFTAIYEQRHREHIGKRLSSLLTKQELQAIRDEAIDYQAHTIRRALAYGKPVPPEVLADYPDLAKAEHHSWSTPRAIAAAATGVLSGLVGSAVPVVGLAGGLLAQVLEKQNPQLQKAQYITEGVVDGSAALLVRSLFRSVQARPMKLTLTEEELDKLEFEAAKKGEYVPSPPRPTKEQFKEILLEKLLKKD